MPAPADFGEWDRAKQIEYLYSTYGNPEDRAKENGIDGAFAGPKFRHHNVNTQPWVSEEEKALWAQVNRDSGTFLGNAFREAAPAALAAGLAYAGGSALLGGGGTGAAAGTSATGATGGIGAGFGTNAGGLGYFANGGTAGLAGLGGGNAGALAASGAIAGGAGALGGGALGTLTKYGGKLGSLLGGMAEPEMGGQIPMPQIQQRPQPQQAPPQSGPPVLPGMPQGPIQGFSRKPFQFLGQTIWM